MTLRSELSETRNVTARRGQTAPIHELIHEGPWSGGPADIEPWGHIRDPLENKPGIQKHRDAFIGEGNEPRAWDNAVSWGPQLRRRGAD